MMTNNLSIKEVWDAADKMIQGYGEVAILEAARQVDRFVNLDDLDGRKNWLRIMSAIEILQTPRGQEPLN